MAFSRPDEAGLQQRLRRLPAVDALLSEEAAAGWLARWPRPVVVDAVRRVLEEARQAVRRGQEPPGREQLLEAVEHRLRTAGFRTLQPLINATGVVLHTNLGRAPLSQAAVEAVARVAGGYSNLEYDLAQGSRGSRHLYGEDLLRHLTGAEAAMIVNNNAAAVLLVLSALCRGREVIISRGEMIEIGGSFRIPEVMAQSGCILKEVGTTNRTHLRDYQEAITDQTAAILKVHTSNYRIEGFTRSVRAAELAPLCRAHGLLLIEDLGSGVLLDTRDYGLGAEPGVKEALEAGCDVVTFSGDKLLGGPQAGLIVGRKEWIEACRRHPLARAVRVDKMTLAALQATLQHYLRGEHEAIPLWRMLGQSRESLMLRATRLVQELRAVVGRYATVEAVEVDAPVGGGSLPGQTLPSVAVGIRPQAVSPQELARRLRAGQPPVVGRLEEGWFLLDLRTVDPDQERTLLQQAADCVMAAPEDARDAGPEGTRPQGTQPEEDREFTECTSSPRQAISIMENPR